MKKNGVFLLVLLLVVSLQATDRHVGSGQTYATITAGYNAAADGDNIIIHPETYEETVHINKDDLTFITCIPANNNEEKFITTIKI